MTFGEAIEALKFGNRVSRPEWAENKVWLEMATEIASDDPPVILAVYDGTTSQWPAPHEDLMAEDWFIPDQITEHTDDPGAF